MKSILCLAAAAAVFATPATAQDFAGPIAATVEQFGQGIAESMSAGSGVFVTAQGRAPMPAASADTLTVTVKGSGKTAVEAVADRNAQLERIRSAANRFDVAVDVGETSFSITETPDWTSTAVTAMPDYSDMGEADAVDAAADAMAATVDMTETDEPATTRTITASVQVKLQSPNESRLPAFIDALAEAGVTDLNGSLLGMNLGQLQPFLSLLGLDPTSDPGEAVWNAATADGITRARAQAQAIAIASGRQLGAVRHVSVLMRSNDGEDALVSVAVRFNFAD